MKSEELVKKLNKINKAYYTAADIERLVDQPRAAVLVMLNRLVKAGRPSCRWDRPKLRLAG